MRACRELEKGEGEGADSYLTVGSRGQQAASPWVAIKAGAAAKMLKVAQDFGMTPAARQRLNLPHRAMDPDPFDEYLDTGRPSKDRFFFPGPEDRPSLDDFRLDRDDGSEDPGR